MPPIETNCKILTPPPPPLFSICCLPLIGSNKVVIFKKWPLSIFIKINWMSNKMQWKSPLKRDHKNTHNSAIQHISLVLLFSFHKYLKWKINCHVFINKTQSTKPKRFQPIRHWQPTMPTTEDSPPLSLQLYTNSTQKSTSYSKKSQNIHRTMNTKYPQHWLSA